MRRSLHSHQPEAARLAATWRWSAKGLPSPYCGQFSGNGLIPCQVPCSSRTVDARANLSLTGQLGCSCAGCCCCGSQAACRPGCGIGVIVGEGALAARHRPVIVSVVDDHADICLAVLSRLPQANSSFAAGVQAATVSEFLALDAAAPR